METISKIYLRLFFFTFIFCTLLTTPFNTNADSEVERVRSRLALVEELLSARDISSWSQEKKEKRFDTLKDLKDYWRRGVFPQNYSGNYHRKPIFVDSHGTACAVGYLMKKKGFEASVRRISETQNELFLEDISDPKLSKFIEMSGLEIEELKLIQPTYEPRDPIFKAIEYKNLIFLKHSISEGRGPEALLTAMSLGNASMVNWLLDQGVDPNFSYDPGRSIATGSLGSTLSCNCSALEYAAGTGNSKVVQTLLDYKADAKIGTPLEFLFSPPSYQLYKNKPNDKEYSKIIGSLLKAGASFSVTYLSKDRYSRVRSKDYPAVIHALHRGGVSITHDKNLPKHLKFPRIFENFGCNSIEDIKLVESALYPEKLDRKGRLTALLSCIEKGDPSVIQYMLSKDYPNFSNGRTRLRTKHSVLSKILENERTDLLPIVNETLPIAKVRLKNGHSKVYWYLKNASLIGLAAYLRKPEIIEELTKLGVKPVKEDLSWAAPSSKRSYDLIWEMLDINLVEYPKLHNHLINIFGDTCQTNRLEKVLKLKSKQLPEKLSIHSQNCSELKALIRQEFPRRFDR